MNQNYSITIQDQYIDDKQTFQTWSSASDVRQNTTTAYCQAKDVILKQINTGKCIENTLGGQTELENIKIRSDVLMATDRVVGVADFAITTVRFARGRVSVHVRQ